MLRIMRFHELLAEYRGQLERNEDTRLVVRQIADIQQMILFIDEMGCVRTGT